MGDAEKRQYICKLCILVKGYLNETNFNIIKQQFPKSFRAELVRRSANFEPRDREWIVQCQSVKDVLEYTDLKILKSPYGVLDISPCELPCDVPEEWLQDSPNVFPQAQPPAYLDIYPGGDHGSSALNTQHPPLGQHDPRVMQQPGQFYSYPAGYRPPWSPDQGPHGPPPGAYWQQQGYYPYGQYSGYPPFGQPGYGYQPPGQPPAPLVSRDSKRDTLQPVVDNRYPHTGQSPAPSIQRDRVGDTSQPVVDIPVSESPRCQMDEDVTMGSFSNTESDVEDQVEPKIEEPKKSTTNMLKVTNLPPSTTEDTLENFFENTRKYGGGDVEQVDYDEETKSAIITFVEEDAVEKVLQKIPILFNKKIIEVEAYVVNVEPPIEVSGEEFYDCEASPQETEVSCTIEVRGMKGSTTEDTILYYFESKKGAQADVEKIEFVEDKNMYLLTFEDDAAAERALSKSHVVDGVQLQVKKHVPPKRYPNKVLVKGLSEKTSKDGLTNYLEARTRKDVKSVDFGDADSQKAIVTFTESIDISEIQTTCKKKALDGCFLTIHPVFLTNCIIVRGYSEKTTENALEFYFDNKRKSGVDGVTDIQMNTDEDYCVIYFEDPNDALVACQKSHVIDSCKLQVQVFYDCLGIPAGDEGPKFKSLSPIIIDTIDQRKVKFLLASKPNKEALEKQLEYATVIWPTGDSNLLKIECTLTKETKDCRTVAKSWEDNTKKKISTFLDMVVVEEHSTLQEAWQSVMEKLRNINISNPDSVAVTVEKQNCKIYIIGHKIQVKEVSDKVKVIIDEVLNDLDKRKQQMQEEINLKHHQLMILVLTRFPDKIRQKFQNIEVKIDTKKLAVTFNGISGDITSAKISMYETLNTIVSASIGDRSPSFIQFLKNPEVGSDIGKKMKAKNVVGVWDIQDNNITMYAMSDEEAVDAANIFKNAIIETKVNVDKIKQSVLRSPKWIQLIKEIEDECQRKSVFTKIVVDNQGQIILFCTATGEAGIIREKIQDFFFFNTENEVTVGLPPAQLKFLQEQMKDELDKLEGQLKQKNVAIAVKSDCILIKGNQQGIKDAEEEIDSLVKNIYKTKHSIDRPGLPEHIESDQGKRKLKQVGKQAGVIISSESDEDEQSSGIRPRSAAISTNEQRVFTTTWGQKVIVVKGDITGLDVDGIVNAANKDLVHSGGLAKVIINKGGDSIQSECNRHIKSHGQMSEGEVFCSAPGKLKCQVIVHAVGPIWQSGRNNEEQRLAECVESSLEETENRNLTSIAFPALCTGIFGYPADEATKVIAETIRDYFAQNQSSTIRTVYLCDKVDKNVDLFEKAGNKFFGNAQAGSSRTPGRGQAKKHSGASTDIQNMGTIEVKILKGELAKMKVDAIVNTTSKNLQLSQGAVSASLSKLAGPIMQQECSQKYPNGINYGDVAVTSGGNLLCQIVCHGTLDQWRPNGSSINMLEKFIDGCLSTADQNGCTSIAFPAMGTGNLGYPKDVVAKTMFSCVMEYSVQNPRSNIGEILFVLYDKDYQTIKAFEDEQKHRENSSGFHHTPGTENTSHQGRALKKDKKQLQPQKAAPVQDTSDDDKIYSVNMGNMMIKVYQGDITTAKVDVIVNGSNADLDLSLGAVAQAIRKKGGKELAKQLDKQKTVMKSDGIAVTTVTKKSPNGLQCDAVIHINMTDVNAANQTGSFFSRSPKLKDKVKEALYKAEELKKSTIAFPALGTAGAAKIPVSEAADEMFKVVEKFIKSQKQHVNEVHVIIYQTDMMKEYIEAIKKSVISAKNPSYFEKFLSWAGLSSDEKPPKHSRHERRLVGAQAPIKTESSSVTFVIYARDKGVAQQAIKMLEQALDNDYIERSVSAKIISEFNDDQIKEVQKLGVSNKVTVDVDKKKSEIKLRGLMQFVSDAVDDINNMIGSAERSKQTKQKAKLVTDIVQWSFMEEDKGQKKLVEYPPEVNLILESALKDQKTEASFYDKSGNKYIVDFNSYEEYPADDITDKVQVLRKSKLVDQTFEPPSTWKVMDDKTNLEMVQLAQQDKEYQDVSKKFLSTAGCNVDFVKIERVQNKTLYQQFIAKKKSMDATNPPGHQNERALWHGFSVDALDSICRYGFNRSYCGKNATMFGAGVYFAVNVNYSLQDTYSRPDASGHKRMFLCRVLTGEYCVGNSTMRVPPVKPGAASHILYDTVTNDVNNPIMFVIFHDSQAFPEYLITFKRK